MNQSIDKADKARIDAVFQKAEDDIRDLVRGLGLGEPARAELTEDQCTFLGQVAFDGVGVQMEASNG